MNCENKSKPEISRILGFEEGETIQIFGENFERNNTKVYWWRENYGTDKQRESVFYPNSAILPELPPENAIAYEPHSVCDGQVLYVDCTSNQIRGGAAVMWVQNTDGFSKPVIVNKPSIWLKSAERAQPGDIISIHGINFGDLRTRRAVLKNSKGEFIDVDVYAPHHAYYPFASQNHLAYIKIPMNISDGEYELYYHCGKGGAYGWSDSVKIAVEEKCSVTDYYRDKWSLDTTARRQLPECNQIVVDAPKNGSLTDMTDEIQAACDEISENGGGVVVLTAGCYGISRTINLKKGVVLVGAGEGATTVCVTEGEKLIQNWDEISFHTGEGVGFAVDWKKPWAKEKNGVMFRIFDDAGIDNLKLDIRGAGVGVLVSANDTSSAVSGAFVTNCRIDNACTNTFAVNAGFDGAFSAGIACVSKTYGLVVYNCNITASVPITILPAGCYYAKIIKNRFENSPRQTEQTYFASVYDSMIVENNFVSGRRGFMTQAGFARNWMFQNRTEDIHRAQNALECYMSEWGGCLWAGCSDELGENYVGVPAEIAEKLEKVDYSNSAHTLTIMDGRGFGQYRKVVGIEGNKIILDKPWIVSPDNNTFFTFSYQPINNLYVDNGTALANGRTQILWGGGIENVISGHNIDLASGFRLTNYTFLTNEKSATVLAFNKLYKCQVRASGKALWMDAYTAGKTGHQSVKRTLGVFGNRISGNAFDGMHSMHYSKNQSAYVDLAPHAGVAFMGSYNSFTDNKIGGYKTGFKFLTAGSNNNFFEKNVFHEVPVRFGGASLPIGPDAVFKD